MPFKALTPEQRVLPAGRVLLWGLPNTFKTSAIVESWPEDFDTPGSKQFISLPGENGYETVPHRPSIVSHVWEVEDIGQITPHQVLREANDIVTKVLQSKPMTVAVEGIHKLYDYAFDACLADLEAEDAARKQPVGTEGLRGPAYGQAHKVVMRFLNKISAAGVPYLVVTCWEGEQKDDPKDRSKNAAMHKAPKLPGQLATVITGQFGVSIRSSISRTPSGIVGKWQILPDPQVWGCAIKVDKAIAMGLPRTIPQDFRVLRDLVAGTPLAEIRQRYPEYAAPAKA